MTAVTAAFVLWLTLPFCAWAAERKTDLSVVYVPPQLSVEANGVSLRRLLEAIGAKVGFSVMGYGVSDKPLTISIEKASLEEALGQILRGENHAFVYGGERGGIEKVILVSSSMYAEAIAASDDQRSERASAAEIVQNQGRATLHSFSTSTGRSTRSPFAEEKHEDSVKNEVKLEDIMRGHAISGIGGVPETNPEYASVYRPFSNRTSNLRSTRASRAVESMGEISETLAMTTRIAQQNLKTLVDALGTATDSLFKSSPKGR